MNHAIELIKQRLTDEWEKRDGLLADVRTATQAAHDNRVRIEQLHEFLADPATKEAAGNSG